MIERISSALVSLAIFDCKRELFMIARNITSAEEWNENVPKRSLGGAQFS